MPRYYDVSDGFKEVSTKTVLPQSSGRSAQTQPSRQTQFQTQQTGVRSMSMDTFKKYQKSFNQWKKTGSYGDTSWMNQSDLDTFNSIREGRGKYVQQNGNYYLMDTDTYDRYGRNRAMWNATGDYGDTSWMKQDELDAFNAIRASQTAEQNQFDDFRYTLDDNILNTVRERFKEQWGSKNYYDWTDPEDVARQAAGQMPKYLAKKYKNNPYDQWLYANDLPSTKDFNDMYSQAVLDWDERQNIVGNIVNGLNDYEKQKSDFMAQQMAGADEEDLLATGNYDAFVKYYGEDKEEDNPYKARQDVVNAEDYTAYDNVYNALYSGDPEQLSAALNEGFWDKYTEKNWQKYLNQKLKWNEDTLEEDIQRATDKALAVQASVNSGKLTEEQLQNIANSIDTESLTRSQADISTRKADVDSRVAALRTQPRLSQEQYVELSTLQNEQQAMQQQLDAVNEQLMLESNSENQLKIIEIRRDLDAQWNNLSRRSDFAQASADLDVGAISGSRKAKAQVLAILASDRVADADDAVAIMKTISPVLGETVSQLFDTSNNRAAINQYMTDDEWSMFRYIANTQGADAAIEYTDSIRPLMNERAYQAEIARRKSGVLGTDTVAGTVAQNIARPFMQFAESKEGLLTELTAGTGLWKLEYHDPRLRATRLRQGILQDTGEQIMTATADDQGNATGWGQVLNTVYNMAQSTADNAVRQLVFGSIPAGGSLSALTMSGSVMGSTLSEYMDKGASAEQAMTLALVNAVAEGIGEKFTFDKYLHIKDGNAAIKAALDSGQKLSWGKYLLHQFTSTAVAEAGEEVVTEVIDKIMDSVVMGDQSEIQQLYDSVKAQGGTDGQAWKKVFWSVLGDIAMAGLGGAFSGVLLGGGNMMVAQFNQGRAATGTAKGAMRAGRDVMLRDAQTQVELTDIYDEAYSHIQGEQHIRNASRTIGQLAEAYRAEIEKNGTVDSAETRAKVIDAITKTTALTDAQKKAICEAYEEYAASPASLLPEGAKNILDNFKTVLDNLDAVASKNGKKARMRELKRQEAREKFVRDVTPIRMRRDQARAAWEQSHSQSDKDTYLAMSQEMKAADEKHQRQEEQAQLRDEMEADAEQRAEKKAAEPVIQAAVELTDSIADTEQQMTERLTEDLDPWETPDTDPVMDAIVGRNAESRTIDTIRNAAAKGDDETVDRAVTILANGDTERENRLRETVTNLKTALQNLSEEATDADMDKLIDDYVGRMLDQYQEVKRAKGKIYGQPKDIAAAKRSIRRVVGALLSNNAEEYAQAVKEAARTLAGTVYVQVRPSDMYYGFRADETGGIAVRGRDQERVQEAADYLMKIAKAFDRDAQGISLYDANGDPIFGDVTREKKVANQYRGIFKFVKDVRGSRKQHGISIRRLCEDLRGEFPDLADIIPDGMDEPDLILEALYNIVKAARYTEKDAPETLTLRDAIDSGLEYGEEIAENVFIESFNELFLMPHAADMSAADDYEYMMRDMLGGQELDESTDEQSIREESGAGVQEEAAESADDIPVSGQERQDSDITEQVIGSGYSERGADNGSEAAGDSQTSASKSWDRGSVRPVFSAAAKSFNDKFGTKLTANDFTAIDSPVNEKSAQALRRSIARTGGIQPRLYTVADGVKAPNGFIQDGQIYVKDTGNSLVSFVYEHEIAHWNDNNNAIQRVARAVYEKVKDRTVTVMVDGEKKEMTALERYCLHLGDDPNDPQTLNEFICDIHGAYGYAVAHGRSLASQLGLTTEDLEPYFEEFAKMGAVEAFEDNDDEGYQTRGLAGFIRNLIGGGKKRGKSDFNYHSMSEDRAKYESLLRDSPSLKGVFDEAEITNLFDTIDSVMDVVGKNRAVLDFGDDMSREERAYSPYKQNSDPHYKLALDFSTLCRKRLLTQSIVERLQSKLKRAVTPQETAAIRNKIKEFKAEGKKVEVACALCYVEAARLKSPKVIDKFLNDREFYLRDYFAKSNKEHMAWVHEQQADFKERHGFARDATKKQMKEQGGASVVKQLDKLTPQWRAEYQPSEVEQRAIERGAHLFDKDRFLNVASLTRMAAGTDDEADKYIYGAFITAVRSATRSKAQESAVPYYYGDVEQVSDSIIDEMNKESGFRHQSWSDFEITHLLDNIAAIIELSTRKAKMHAYTKVPAMVAVNGLTNMMLNMSLIPEGGTGIRNDDRQAAQNLLNRYTELLNQQESGADVSAEMSELQNQLADIITMDPVEGMPREEMERLRDAYSKTAGNIMIGINDLQIKLLLASDLIDYVIPYHASGLNKDMRKRMGIKDWDSYQNTQNEKPNGRGDPEEAPKLAEWFDIDEARNAADGVRYMQEASQRYLDLCYERNLEPKFPQFLNRRADGSYELADDARNYWKLLIDRKMVDQTDNSIIEQKAVVPKFDKAKLMQLLDEELQDPSHIDDQEVSDKIVDMFLSGNLKPTAADKKDAADIARRKKNINERATLESIEELASQTQHSSHEMVDPETLDREYDDAVKRGDDETVQRMVDDAAERAMPKSAIRTKDGRLRKVFHGTNADRFRVFDESYIGSASGDDGFFGRGFYFGYTAGEAGYYGSRNVIPAYLDIRKPFDFQKELGTYNGERAKYGRAPDAVEYLNFAEKFPDIAKNITIGVVRKEDGRYSSISLQEFADAFRDVIENKDFRVEEIDGAYGKEYLVTADYVNDSYTDADGKEHTFSYADYQQRSYEQPTRLDMAFNYLNGHVFDHVDIGSFTSEILYHGKEFTDALKQRGYDGTMQSEDGDEVVAFYPWQIKSAEEVTYDENGKQIPLSERFNEKESDFNFSSHDIEEPLLDPDGNRVQYAANIRPDKRTKTDYADLILNGLKTVETRKARTLDPLANGEWQAIAKNGQIVGYVKFGQPYEYQSVEEYRNDFNRHRVPLDQNAEFEWTQKDADNGIRRFAYPILEYKRLDEPVPVPKNYTELRKYKRFDTNDGTQFSSTNVKESTAEEKKQHAVEVQRQAQALYEQGTTLSDYAKMDSMYDDDVASQLRGMYLRNGIDVGGRLSDEKAEEIANDSKFWKRIVMPAMQFPQRVFRKMGRAWDNKTDEGMMRNFHASEKYSNMFYSYKNQQLQEENIFKANATARVQAIGASETDSVLAQLIGERIVSPAVAKNALTDGKWIVIPNGAGLMVLDKKGRVRYMMDSKDKFFFDDNTLKQIADKRRQIRAIREDGQGNKADRIKAVQEGLLGAAKRLSMTSTFEVQGDTIIIKDGNKEILRVKGQKAYTDKAQQLADTLSDIYADMYGRVQQTLVENGYKKIGHRDNYFPHFQMQREGLNGALDFLHAEDLPVSIAGMTEWFSPSKPWAAHLLERLGDQTDFNAVRGFAGYLNSVSDVIFMTPVIQRVRQLESIVRTGGDEESRANNANSALVQWLHEYANGLANKKSALDRSVEALFGRQIYQIIPKISGIAGATYVVGNISSALTNFAPLFQAMGQMNPKYIAKGIFDTSSDTGEFSDGIQNAIPFLTNRLTEIDQINLNLGEQAKAKGMKIMTALMNGVDQFTATAVARAKYYELMDSGYSQEDAIRETDKFCTDLFAERSKGSKPNLFNSRVLSPFTQFQLEPFNQLWHWSDIHDRNMQKEYERILRRNNGVIDGIDFSKMENQFNRMGVAWKDLAAILGRMISMSVFGLLMRGLRGSDATWNPLGMAQDAYEGYQRGGASGFMESVMGNIEDNAPFLSTMTGSSPVPIVNVAQNIGEELTEDWNGEASLMDNMLGVAGNIPSAALYAVPAGSQIRKSVEGVKAYRAGGNYTDAGNLRYPIEQNAGNLMRSVLFGRSAVAPRNYQWGKDVVQGADVEDYKAATERGVDQMDAYNFFLHDYNTQAKVSDTTKAAAVMTSNLDEREQDIIADVLGIKLPSEQRLQRDLEKYRKETERKHNKGKIKDDTYNRRMTAIDYYMELLNH